MKVFKVYARPGGTHQAVKQGWSWPAFFFTWIWASAKRMWVLGSGVFALFMLLNVMGALTGTQGAAAFLPFSTLVTLGTAVVLGVNGNRWRASNLRARGYALAATVTAPGPDAALALAREAPSAEPEAPPPPP